MSARRDVFAQRYPEPPEKNSTHAGLWLDKFICHQDYRQEREQRQCRLSTQKDHEPKRLMIRQIAGIKEPDGYNIVYARWKEALDSSLNARTDELRLIGEGRLAIGLGAENVLENSLTIHRTYGVPYIPGSALKGLAAAFARQHLDENWAKGGKFYNFVFGKTDDSGFVTFHDALYVAGSGGPFAIDVITVHHKGYYQAKPQETPPAPADWDDPTIIPFLAATGKYLIALSTPVGAEKLLDPAWRILTQALEHKGIGAKTSTGYGRLKHS
jgi:CRISPR-associated protein Cmr6